MFGLVTHTHTTPYQNSTKVCNAVRNGHAASQPTTVHSSADSTSWPEMLAFERDNIRRRLQRDSLFVDDYRRF